jgi:diguanylate cyclase (GGDEF)-like protein
MLIGQPLLSAAMWRALSRSAAALLLAVCPLLLAAAPAAASTSHRIDLLDGGCQFTAAEGLPVQRAFARWQAGDCGAGSGGTRWLVKGGLEHLVAAGSQLTLRTKQTHFERMRVHVGYADGGHATLTHDARNAGDNIEFGGIVRLDIPGRLAPVAAVAIEIVGASDPRGAFVRPTLSPLSDDSARGSRVGVSYGLFGGIVLATLAFSLVLALWLRYDFLLHYCGMAAASLVYGVAASGMLFWLGLPLPPGAGVIVGEFTMGALTLFAVLFTLALLEAGTVPRRLARLSVAAAVFTFGSGTAVVLVATAAPALVTYPLIALNVAGAVTLLLSIPLIAFAVARGSRVIYLFLAAWTLPIVAGLARILAGTGLIATTPLIENSHFYAMSVEVIVSMFGIAYRIAHLRSERDTAQARERELTQLAETDALTGLLNRRGFIDSVTRSSGERQLILIDIDHFKTVNDGFGHEVGDRVLIAAAELIERVTPHRAIVGRLGGEEFAVAAALTDAATARALVSAFRATPMPEGIRLTVSAGTASGPCRDDVSWRHLYRRADAALYRAKANGRNRVETDPHGAGNRVAA